jgi:hypothetical protein
MDLECEKPSAKISAAGIRAHLKASQEDVEAWFNNSSELQSLILICHYYPAYDLEKAGRLSRLQIQLLLEGIRLILKVKNQ